MEFLFLKGKNPEEKCYWNKADFILKNKKYFFSSSDVLFYFNNYFKLQCINMKTYIKQRILHKIIYLLITGIFFQSISTTCITELEKLWPCNAIKEKCFSSFGIASQCTYFLCMYCVCVYKHEMCIYITFSFVLTFCWKRVIPKLHFSTLGHSPNRRNTSISFIYSYWSAKLDTCTSDTVLNFSCCF